MLTKYDKMPYHQIVSTFDRVDSSDKRVLQDLSGGVNDTLCEFKCGKDVGYGIPESVVIVA